MDEDELRATDTRRFDFLKKIADDGGSDIYAMLSMWDIGEELGYTKRDTETIAQYLVDEGLLQYVAMGGTVAITHLGIKELEAALRKPAQPTQHFPPVNIMYVASMQNSQVQQGTHHSTQTGVLTARDLDVMRDWVEAAHRESENLGLDAESLDEFRSQIATLMAQLQSKNPKPGILREAGKSVRAILEGATGNVAGGLLLTQLLPLLAMLG